MSRGEVIYQGPPDVCALKLVQPKTVEEAKDAVLCALDLARDFTPEQSLELYRELAPIFNRGLIEALQEVMSV